MMIKILRGLVSIFLCFCLICSLCGVAFASSPDWWNEWLESIDYGNNWPPAGDTTLSGGDSSTGEDPPPVLGDDSSSSEDPPSAPSPDDGSSFEDTSSDPDKLPSLPPGFPGLPGGDTPAYDPNDVDGQDPSGDTTPGVTSGEGTYIVLPDNFIIQSAGYDDTLAIDPYSLAPVTPSNTSGLKSVLLSILGNYDPIVAQYQYSTGSNYGYIREIQPDYVWIVSAAVFAILLYCTWRLLGGLICSR